MSAEGALIVAQQQRIKALEHALKSQSQTLAEWKQFFRRNLPTLVVDRTSDFTGLLFQGRETSAIEFVFCHRTGFLSVPFLHWKDTTHNKVSKIVISTSENAFHLLILCEGMKIRVHEQPGTVDVEGCHRSATIEYPRDYNLGFGETFMTFLREIQAHPCNFEIVMQE